MSVRRICKSSANYFWPADSVLANNAPITHGFQRETVPQLHRRVKVDAAGCL